MLKNEDRHKKADKLGPDYELIFKMPIARSLQFMKHTNTLGFFFLPTVSFCKYWDLTSAGSTLLEINESLIGTGNDVYWFAAGFVLFNLALALHVNAIPLRIYRNKKR